MARPLHLRSFDRPKRLAVGLTGVIAAWFAVTGGAQAAVAEEAASVDLPFDGIPQVIADIRFSSDGRWLAMVSTEDPDCFKHPETMGYKTRIFDVSKRRCAYTLNFGETTAWSVDGALIAVGNDGDKVTLWDVKSGKVVDTLRYLPHEKGIMKRLAFDQAGNLYGAIEGGTDNQPDYGRVLNAQVWWKAKREDTKEPSQITGRGGRGCAFDLSIADIGRESRVAIARFDCVETVRVVKGETLQPEVIPEHKIEGLKQAFVCLTPDGRRLAVCGETGNALYEIGGKVPKLIFEDKGRVRKGLWRWWYLYVPSHTLDASVDSRLLLIPGSTNSEIILAQNGKRVAALPGNSSVALSPDGQFIARYQKGGLKLSRVASLPKN